MAQELIGLFADTSVRVLTDAVSDDAVTLMSKREAVAVANVVGKRRREYAAARALARKGLARFFGLHEFDLLNGEDRAPIWPHGITGSLSHSSTRAWVALVDASHGTVGIDGENREGLKSNLWRLTLRPEEITALDAFPAGVRERRALIMFSAKEALYKAQYPWSRKYVDFEAVQVHLDKNGDLRCTFRKKIGPFPIGFVVEGRWLDGEEVVTGVSIPPLDPGT